MADYYENQFLQDLGEEFADPIDITNFGDVTPETIISMMRIACEENDIPAELNKRTIEISAGLFRKQENVAVEISHPNPPQSYCKQLYIFFGGCIRGFFVGSSAAFSEINNYEAAVNGTGGSWRAQLHAIAGIEPNMEQYEQEIQWHQTIYTTLLSLLN